MKKSPPGMSTFTGRFIDFLNPTIEMVEIEDIAHSLSMICRFNGQCDHFYSVAEHSVYASHQVSPEMAMTALLHDAPEAYVGDVVGPLKAAMRMLSASAPKSSFDIIENRWATVIGARFGVEISKLSPEVKEVDARMLVTERRDIFSKCPLWPPRAEDPAPYEFKIEPRSPLQAKKNFLRRYDELCRAETGRCAKRSPQGLTCGLPVGHKGSHNALGWGLSVEQVKKYFGPRD